MSHAILLFFICCVKPVIGIMLCMPLELIISLIFVFISVIISITLHEAMHAYAGLWLGDDTAKEHGRLTFNPLAHIDLFTTVLLPLLLVSFGAPPFGMAKPVPFDPSRVKFEEFGAALVALAGPATNLLLAVIAGLIIQFVGSSLAPMLGYFILTFCIVNLSFFLFNIIPFPPLDGSRLLYALAPDFIRRGMEVIESAGIFAIAGFFFIFYIFLAEPFSRLLKIILTFLTGTSLL